VTTLEPQLNVLITGAAGNLGTKLSRHLDGRFALRLLDKEPGPDKRIVRVDLSDWSENLSEQFRGVDVVVHLAANPNDLESWANLVSTNLDATINAFIAASRAGVSRFIYASSNHAMGGYKDDSTLQSLTVDCAPRPGTRFSAQGKDVDSVAYGAMKLFGERLGKCYAQAAEMTVVAVRIGWVQHGENRPDDMPADADPWFRSMWLSNRDFCHLMERCIGAELADRFVVVNGMSANVPMVWDIEHTRSVLGYEPKDSLTNNNK
jgi:NAD+ dependent glucose-6-phosphate dehydrogenase